MSKKGREGGEAGEVIMKTSAAERRKKERERSGGNDEDTQVVKRQDRGRAIRRTRNKGRRLGGGGVCKG